MEQDDLKTFIHYMDRWDREVLRCLRCGQHGVDVKTWDAGTDVDLLMLMEDAAAHFAQVHRKSNEV